MASGSSGRAGFVDAHHHVWDLTRRAQPWLGEAGLEPLRRSFSTADLVQAAARGVAGRRLEATVLVQCLASTPETEELLALAAGDDLVAGVVGWVDLTRPGVAGELDRLAGLPGGRRLVGIRHLVQAEPDPGWLLRDDVGRGLTEVASRGLRFDLLVLPHQLPGAVALARRMPQLQLVLDHAAKPPLRDGDLRTWSADLRALAAAGPVTCKVSGMVTEAGPSWLSADLRPAVEQVLEAFGPARTMFGSDWPVCEAAGGWSRWAEAAEELLAALSAAELDDVLRQTARRSYGLDLSHPDRGEWSETFAPRGVSLPSATRLRRGDGPVRRLRPRE
jgi:predicted TIM-barrel fold metal-dependent hydrolase